MTIRVSIVAYMDNELEPTINDMLSKATRPEDIAVYISNQDTEMYKYTGKAEINIYHTTPEDSDGYSSCRETINSAILHDSVDDDYYLQVAPHSRFAQDWDKKYIAAYKKLAKDNDKFILCCRQHEYDLPNNKRGKPYFYAPITGWSASSITARTKTIITEKEPFEVGSFQAGGVFTKMDWVRDVPVDTNIFLWGEETDIPLRTFGQGYKVFHLAKPLCYHLYHQQNRKATGKVHEPDRFTMRNEAGKKYVLDKLAKNQYKNQKEWMDLNNLVVEDLKTLHKQFTNSYTLTETQNNFLNNTDNAVNKMKIYGIHHKKYAKVMEAMEKIGRIVDKFNEEVK